MKATSTRFHKLSAHKNRTARCFYFIYSINQHNSQADMHLQGLANKSYDKRAMLSVCGSAKCVGISRLLTSLDFTLHSDREASTTTINTRRQRDEIN